MGRHFTQLGTTRSRNLHGARRPPQAARAKLFRLRKGARRTDRAERTPRMKVIGVGVGRTGTLSLKAALERVGFGPCFHMRNVLDHRDRLPLWEAAADGESV